MDCLKYGVNLIKKLGNQMFHLTTKNTTIGNNNDSQPTIINEKKRERVVVVNNDYSLFNIFIQERR